MAHNIPSPPQRGRGQGRSSDQGRHHHKDRDNSMLNLWPKYLEGGYFDEKGHLRPDYVARTNIMPIVQNLSRARPQLTVHQMRRYFQHCRAIESKLKSGRSSWEAERTNLMRIDIAAKDAYGKTQRKIPALFHDFIQQNVAMIKSKKDFLEGFLLHFEALVGFSSGTLRDSERK